MGWETSKGTGKELMRLGRAEEADAMAASMVAPLPACDGFGLATKPGQGRRDAGRGLSTGRASPALPPLCLRSPLHGAVLIPAGQSREGAAL